jgi:muramidase (phage lysozyme)
MASDIDNALMSLFDEAPVPPVQSLRPQARPETGFKPTTTQQVGTQAVDIDFALLSLFEDQEPVVGQAPVQASYEIKSGDTLEQIALSGGFTLPDLLAVNPQITEPGKLSLGQKISIPSEDQITRPYVVPPNLAGKSQDILSFISKGEGGYDASNKGTKDNVIVGTQTSTVINGKPLSQSTIQEIQEAQSNGLFAVGRYQLIPETFNTVVEQLGIPEDAVFTPELQDQMGTQLLFGTKRPKLAAYLRGESDDIDVAMLEFAKEWASIPDPNTGRSYYASKGNKAQHTVEETKQILQSARAKFSEGET